MGKGISQLAHIDPSAKIGKDVTIHAFAYIDADVEIGDGCEIMPYASIIHDTRIGNNTKVYQNAVVGADPQDFRWQGERGLCVIGNNCVIRENVIINRSIREGQATTIGDEVYVLAESHIGHDSLIKGKTVLGNGVTIAGDAEVGECTIMSSNTMLHERCKIGDWVLIKGGCRIGNNVPPYSVFAHNPAEYDGVNAVVMTRHGFTMEKIDDIAKAYRHVYQSGTSIFNAVRRIKNDIEPSPERENILNFIDRVNQRLVDLKVDTADD
ncbi:MAG: acyl-ACP--UDP-N-acetylglucosamine O-acyltransferase [Candidatus Amulumruptor caecigallinarius]|uniref:Acyl-ACP--UDP-N-acetylglucosamine O-acyltransferase n=1 Tax=Candidatus Amulumruptor caecigallinarius TaxID=2109911 RepID=A0A4Q0U927_9BACT|nr:MAG: acyl-ACP--UDP-N-acetylglucosamine O-acyltransferase [Candidatus Amulumruptor caecigallinarius]HJE39207.1 acyl-ACP--UDP-N-acetylglucosamine O-acyltransferase [Candidatus Amulumruptor caecigallinarius]